MKNFKKFSLVSAIALGAFMFTPSAGFCGDDGVTQEMRNEDSAIVRNVIRAQLKLAPDVELKDEHYAQVKELMLIGFDDKNPNLKGKRLNTLPPEIFKCTNLEKLYASSNNIGSIPAAIGSLKKLQFASFGRDGNIKTPPRMITEIPAELFTLPALVQVGLSYQALTKLPDSVKNAPKTMAFLSLRQNLIAEIPTILNGLLVAGTLQQLDVTNNTFLWPKQADGKNIDTVKQTAANNWVKAHTKPGVKIRTS